MKLSHISTIAALAMLCTTPAMAQIDIDYEASATGTASTGDFAPYYIASNRGGTVTQGSNALAAASFWHPLDSTERFSYGFGAEVWGGYSSDVDYLRYNLTTGSFDNNSQHPARIWLQQAYVDLKWRSIYGFVGMKRHTSPLLNTALSSGDLTMSGNARPGTGAMAGFIDFQDIPGTRGWLQIDGEIGFYRMANGKWMEHHYNYYNQYLTTSYWFNYKYCYFRTKPTEPLVLTIGMQAGYQFAGDNTYYERGVVSRHYHMKGGLAQFFKALVPSAGSSNEGDKTFVEGNHLGTWDIALQYSLKSGHKLRAYYQTPWEDGSGLGKFNGFDGLWGLEYKAPEPSYVDGVVVEYLDFTNQSGPLHWDTGDLDGSPIGSEATGSDDYYNNYCYNGYQSFGMSIGSPFVKSPIYNTDGYMRYAHNVMRGFHIGISGQFNRSLRYRVLASRRTSWGTPFVPLQHSQSVTSAMTEVNYKLHSVPGLTFNAQLAIDRGSLYGNNFGGLFSVTYTGNFSLGK